MRALVIDDSKPIRFILTEILEGLGFKVQQAENGLEALEVLKTEKIDIALVDWNMPEMNGHEFVKAVRKDNTYNNMLMMMVTTETAIEKVTEALESGANEYIMKPFTKDMISEKLALMGIDIPSTPK
jgi:two-component system chemotaxis response regulator CheY